MDYVTNYYKNICEQLHAKANYLENLILEYRKTAPVYVDVDDIDPYTGEDTVKIIGNLATKKGNPSGKGAMKNRSVSFYPSTAFNTIRNYRGDQEADAEEIVADWGRPRVEDNPIYASMKGKGPPLEVERNEIERERTRRGGSKPGTGKKVKKKERAIRRAEYDREHGNK